MLSIVVVMVCISIGQTAQPSLSDIAGEYITSNGMAGLTGYVLTLKVDGTYSRKWFTDDGSVNTPPEVGKYSLKDYVLSFEPPKGETYRLYLIRWGGRTYVAEDISRFVAAVNVGLEPRGDAIPQDNLENYIYIRLGDEKIEPTGQPVTVKTADELLSAPHIEIQVTGKQLESQALSVSTNKGSADGLRLGMCFFEKRSRNTYDPILCVTSVTDHLARLTDPWAFRTEISVGDTLTNRLIK